MTDPIDTYISQQTAASICCISEKVMPYCFSCFYAYNKEEHLLYYKSSDDTKHSISILNNPLVAGTILPDKLRKFLVKGIQFEGEVLPEDHTLSKNAATNYYFKHPMAVAVPGMIWTIQINHIKMTDSSLGFGKKIIWQREV